MQQAVSAPWCCDDHESHTAVVPPTKSGQRHTSSSVKGTRHTSERLPYYWRRSLLGTFECPLVVRTIRAYTDNLANVVSLKTDYQLLTLRLSRFARLRGTQKTDTPLFRSPPIVGDNIWFWCQEGWGRRSVADGPDWSSSLFLISVNVPSWIDQAINLFAHPLHETYTCLHVLRINSMPIVST